jgi:hypothetical protein
LQPHQPVFTLCSMVKLPLPAISVTGVIYPLHSNMVFTCLLV